MANFTVHGQVIMDIVVEVEADDAEDAREICENNLYVEEYCNNTLGVGGYDDAIRKIDISGACNMLEWNDIYWRG